MLVLAILVAALLAALWTDRIPLSADRANPDSNVPVRGKSRLREMDSNARTTRKRVVDPKLVQQRLDELLERYPEVKPEIRDVPDHENGHLAWVQYSEEMMKDIELPDCLSHYVTEPTPENRKCAEEWLNRHKNIERALVEIAALVKQSMGDTRLDERSTPGVKNLNKAFHLMLARGLILAEDGNEPLARSMFASAMGLVSQMDGIEATSLIGRVIATSARTMFYQTFLDRIYPSLAKDMARLSAWRDTLSPGDTRDGLTRAVIGSTLKDAALMTSSSLYDELHPFIDFSMTNADIRFLVDTQFELNAKVITALKSESSLESIPAIYSQPVDTSGLSGESLEFFNDLAETAQSALTAILKKETRIMMYDAALAAVTGEPIPLDPVSGKPFLWDEATMTLSAPEGTTPQKPVTLPAGD